MEHKIEVYEIGVDDYKLLKCSCGFKLVFVGETGKKMSGKLPKLNLLHKLHRKYCDENNIDYIPYEYEEFSRRRENGNKNTELE